MQNEELKITSLDDRDKETEKHLTVDQKELSDARAKNFEQRRPPWGNSFESSALDENFVRKEPSPDEVKNMDETIDDLGKLMEGYQGKWLMDGAINISLMRGEYIGVHKDTDISIEESELEMLDGHLLSKGYGLFISEPTVDEKSPYKMTRVGADKARANSAHLMAAAIDKDGKIIHDAKLNYIDIHPMCRNAEGQAVGPRNIVLPKKWTEPVQQEVRGNTINISDPARTVYYKLKQGRKYDFTDLATFAKSGSLSMEDLQSAQNVLEADLASTESESKDLMLLVSKHLKAEETAGEIFEVLQQIPQLASRINKETEVRFRKLAEVIAELPDRSSESLYDGVNKAFGIGNLEREQIKELSGLKTIIGADSELENVRNEIKLM